MKCQGKSGHFSVPKIAQKYEGLAWRKLFSAPKIFLKYAAKFSLTLDKSWLGLLFLLRIYSPITKKFIFTTLYKSILLIDALISIRNCSHNYHKLSWDPFKYHKKAKCQPTTYWHTTCSSVTAISCGKYLQFYLEHGLTNRKFRRNTRERAR